MEPELVQDIQLPSYWRWSEKAFCDPLHPCHGPLPDLVQLWRCGDYDFKAALWSAQIGIYVTVELLMEEFDPLLLPATVLYAVRGWIMQTYFWKLVDGNSISCFDVRLVLPGIPDDYDERRKMFCTDILRESVRFAVQRKG